MFLKSHHADAPDHQRYDEVRIVTVPRYKESGLSGDEWRISARVDLMKKGKVLLSKSFSDVETAAQCLPALLCGYPGDFIDEFDSSAHEWGLRETCDQEGCNAAPRHWFALKKRFRRDGSEYACREPGEYRQFCNRHRTRGDCGLDDADVNYDHIQSIN